VIPLVHKNKVIPCSFPSLLKMKGVVAVFTVVICLQYYMAYIL